MLLNGLGRFQNAPERETMNFQWFWEVLGGVVPRTRARALWPGGSVRTLKLPFTTYNTPLPLTIYHLLFNPH